jgi:2-polyprenyl-3-methyl-5-hydroxy-6-metoxy-1,4-benzoquinol methylase
MSISYYDRHGDVFFAGSVYADMSATQARFQAYLPSPAEILEGGCGSGRDALAFAEAGHRVTAFDGSSEMVRRAREHTGLSVIHMTFDQVEWVERFDGIWTCASLLHVPRAELPDVLSRLARAMKPGGAWMTSFKRGTTERQVEDRRFTDMTEDMLSEAMSAQRLTVAELWTEADVRPGRAEEHWVSAIAIKAADGA